MMNVKRRENFTLDVIFDCALELLRDFRLEVRQNGKLMLTKGREEAALDESGRRAFFVLSGEETARLRPFDPAWAQASARLADGEEVFSEVAELNVVDVLGAWEGGV